MTQFSFAGSLAPLDNYNSSFSSALGLMTKGIGIVTAINGAMMSFASSSLNAVDAMGQMSRETGTSIEYLQEMGYVASVNGGSVDALKASVIGLTERIGEYAALDSGEGKVIFENLGISVKKANGEIKNAEEVMEDLRQSFVGMDKSKQLSIARKLGIDGGMLQTLNLTNKQLSETRKRVSDIGVVSKDDADKVMAFNDAVTTSNMALTAISRQISLGMLPSMNGLVDTFNELVFANADLIKNGLSQTIFWFQSVMSAVTNTGKVILGLVDNTIGLKGALMLAGGAALYFGRALWFSPIGLWTAGIAGIIAVVDDLYTMFMGGESVIQDWFNSFDIDILSRMKLFVGELKVGLIQITSTITSLLITLGKAGNFLGFDIDVAGLEKMKKLREDTITWQRNQNALLSATIGKNEGQLSNQNQTNNITQNVTQNIQGNEAQGIADLSTINMKDSLSGALSQIPLGGR